MHSLNANSREHSERFLGSWRLIFFEQILPSGEVSKPFGDSPSGLILHQADSDVSTALRQECATISK